MAHGMVERVVPDGQEYTVIHPDTDTRRNMAIVGREVRDAECTHLDPDKQAGGGHPMHFEGGAETMWVLNSQLMDGIRRFDDDTRRLRARIQELELRLAQAEILLGQRVMA